MSNVLGVVTNWKRPENVPAVLAALRSQVQKLVVVDQAGTADSSWPVDDVWRWKENAGCSCRFLPAFAELDCYYTLFCDDDLLPSPECVSRCVAASKRVEHAVVGQTNRVFRLDRIDQEHQRYNGRWSVQPCDTPTPVHLACQLQFVRTRDMHAVLMFRKRLQDAGCPSSLLRVHDDFLLNLGLQMHKGVPSYCVSGLIKERLPEPHAVWRRDTHFQEREEMVGWALRAGWTTP